MGYDKCGPLHIYQSVINHLEIQIFYNNIYVDVIWGNGKCLRKAITITLQDNIFIHFYQRK